MKKPKSKAKQLADQKRGRKRSLRLKASRLKVAKRRQAAIEKRAKEKREYEEFMKKMLEARMRGEF
jgi:hypothetical protein